MGVMPGVRRTPGRPCGGVIPGGKNDPPLCVGHCVWHMGHLWKDWHGTAISCTCTQQ